MPTMSDEEFDRLCEEMASDDDLVPAGFMEYDDWLEWTGKDDSFVGDPDNGTPGTADLYNGAIRVLKRPPAPGV